MQNLNANAFLGMPALRKLEFSTQKRANTEKLCAVLPTIVRIWPDDRRDIDCTDALRFRDRDAPRDITFSPNRTALKYTCNHDSVLNDIDPQVLRILLFCFLFIAYGITMAGIVYRVDLFGVQAMWKKRGEPDAVVASEQQDEEDEEEPPTQGLHASRSIYA